MIPEGYCLNLRISWLSLQPLLSWLQFLADFVWYRSAVSLRCQAKT